MDISFKILLEQINSNIEILNNNGFKLHDEENPEYFMKEAYYNPAKDELMFKLEEEEVEPL